MNRTESPVTQTLRTSNCQSQEPGMIFTIEPMVNAGRYHTTVLSDGWTVVTKDRSLSAQWEHMVLVTETGYDILTCSKGTQEPPAWVKGWKKPSFD